MITIVYGRTGVGKSAYIASKAVSQMTGLEGELLYRKSCASIDRFNRAGHRYSYPGKVPVYSDFAIRAAAGYKREVSSYYINGFYLGFANANINTLYVAPGSKIYLSEAQRYYNSRTSSKLPDWMFRFYEMHRHFDLDITMDVQRFGLIDLNIRELAHRCIEVAELRHEYDELGNIRASNWKLREYESMAAVEGKVYQEAEHRYEGNIFDSYDSRTYEANYLPEIDFDYLEHGKWDGDVNINKAIYSYTAPEGYYKK